MWQFRKEREGLGESSERWKHAGTGTAGGHCHRMAQGAVAGPSELVGHRGRPLGRNCAHRYPDLSP